MALIIDNILSEGILSGSTLYIDNANITNLIVTNVTGTSTTDTYVTGFTFNTSTRILSLSQNEGQSGFTVTIPDTFVTGLTVNNTTGVLNISRNEGLSDLTTTLGFITGGSFTQSNGTLTLTKITGSSVNITGLPFANGNRGDVQFRAATAGVFTANTRGYFVWNDNYTAGTTTNVIGSLTIGPVGTPLINNPLSVNIDLNDYFQVNIQNINAGNFASSDLVVTADNGNDNNFFGDFGINSSTFNDPAYSVLGPNDVYLYSNGSNLALGTDTANKNVIIFAGGTLSSNLVSVFRSDGTLVHPLTISAGTTSTSNLVVRNLPTLNNANSDFLTRNTSTGDIEYSTPGSNVFYAYGVGFAQSIGNYLT